MRSNPQMQLASAYLFKEVIGLCVWRVQNTLTDVSPATESPAADLQS
jgi:hypothetical protein